MHHNIAFLLLKLPNLGMARTTAEVGQLNVDKILNHTKILLLFIQIMYTNYPTKRFDLKLRFYNKI